MNVWFFFIFFHIWKNKIRINCLQEKKDSMRRLVAFDKVIAQHNLKKKLVKSRILDFFHFQALLMLALGRIGGGVLCLAGEMVDKVGNTKS